MTDNRDAHTEETNRVRETYAAMRARIPQRDLGSAREEFDRWVARIKADAAAEIVAAVEALYDELCAFDLEDCPVPPSVDVPDDYELGVLDSGARLRAALSAGRTALDASHCHTCGGPVEVREGGPVCVSGSYLPHPPHRAEASGEGQ